MEIKDLKIGDWIYSGTYDKVTAIIGNDAEKVQIVRQGQKFNIAVEDVKPIKLTSKLLEKIGFDPIDYTYYYKDAAIREDEYAWNLSINKGIQDYEKRIFYLHELQHELWDNDIEIKIELQ